MSPIAAGPRQVTVNDIIHADPQVIALKKQYQETQAAKNQKILDISYVEADIIKTMGAFEYLNGFDDVDQARTDLLPEFRRLLTKKHILIEEIKDVEKTMEELTAKFNARAEEIVKELQGQFQQSGESAPESAPDVCDCGQCHGECKGHTDAQTAEHTED